MSVTIPNYAWDFRQALSSNSTISDNISNITAIYGSNVSSTATNGVVINGNGGSGVDDVTLPNNLSFSSSYSLEFYVRHNTNANYAGICSFRFGSGNEIVIDMYSTQRKLRFYMWSGGSNDFASHSTDGTHDGTQMTIDGSTYHHMVCNYNGSTGQAEYYQDGTRVWYQTGISTDESDFPIVASELSALGDINLGPNMNMKYFRIWTNHALSSSEVTTLYNNRDTNYFSFSNLRVNYGDVYLAQTLNKTIEDYKNENIPLHDISFAAFTAINRLKETYIQGPVDISGELIVRSNKNTFYDISASKIGFSTDLVTPKIITNDLSLNNRFFVGGDASFNGNVTIQGDLSWGSTISLSNTIANSAVNVDSTGVNTFTNDVSLNANLAIHGKTTVKNDLYLNAYTDVSANPVLSDGTYLKNMKMDKLNHRYIMDISRSAPFSTLTSNTLPSEIWDNSSNSGICVSADGKHIRTVNSGDLSSNATSYYSEDYGSSFHEDEELSQKLSQFDVSINSLDDYYATVVPGQSYTNEPEGTTGLWSGSGNTSASFTHSSGTYTIATNSVLDGQSGDMYNVVNVFAYSTGSSTSAGHAMNRTGWTSSVGTNLWRHSSTSLTAYDANNSATTYNGDYITVTTPYSFQMTQIGFANHWAGNLVNKFMIIGEDSTGTNRVLLTETNHNGSIGSFTTFTVSTTYLVNKFYLHITEINSSNKFTGIRKLRWNGTTPDTSTQELRPKFGSDKIFMSYNGQHQLVPKGVSNKLTYDDYLYVSNNFGKNWNLRKSSTLRTFNYTVTANGSSNYILNGETYTTEDQPTVNIGPNESVIFTIDTTTNGSHPFKIGTSSDDDEITDSRITSVTSGSNQIITFTPTTSGTFYYYCDYHSGMGNSITVANYNMGPFSSNAWFWNTGAVSADGKHMYVSGSTGFWKSSDYGRIWNQTSADSSFNYMSISADGKLVYGVNERKVYGSTDYGNTFSTLYTDAYTSDSSYCGISTSGNGKYITLADVSGSNIYMSSDYGNSFALTPAPTTAASVTYDWNFLVSGSNGHVINDTISNISATYSDFVSDTTNGAVAQSKDAVMTIPSGSISLSSSHTFEMIVKLDSSVDYTGATHTADSIFDFYNSDVSSRVRALVNGGSLVFNFEMNNTRIHQSSYLSLSDDTFYHIVCVTDTTNSLSKIYVNGTVSSYSLDSSPNQSDFPFVPSTLRIGSNGDGGAGQATNIHIKKFRIWPSTVLSASEVGALYNSQNGTLSLNCGMSHSGKIILNSNHISFDYGNNFHYVPNLISNNLSNRDTFYSKANMEYILDPSNNALLQIPYKSAIFQDIYSVGSIKAGSTTYSSDYRLKENVQPLTENETVNELHPVKYYNTNLKKNDYGLLAHELQEKYPFLVSGEKDGAEKQSINYNGLISLLVHEVKNLKKEYQELVEMKNNA